MNGDKAMLSILRDETGQSLVEYGLLLGFVTLAAVLAIRLLGPSVSMLYENATSEFPAS